ncbi:MAG: glycosyltransferase family 9 protein [Verrucomicrobiales bacterium]
MSSRLPRKLILRNFQSPGDLLMLTAAVRDLHRCYPGRFLTDVRTCCPDLWRRNPFLTPLSESDRTVRVIDCQYPLIHQSNEREIHFINGFIDFLNGALKLDIKPTALCGDIHLAPAERRLPAAVEEILAGRRFWIICAGGKYDYTIKWWSRRRYQEVVDHFRGRLSFVQVGESGHYHPPLRDVVDLRGRTTLRDLIRLVHHADGVLCGVTLLMHLAAAVPPFRRGRCARGCVVVAGGREPPHWEAYPGHQFLHTIGKLHCCADGGCWRSRTVPLGDGEHHDDPNHLCLDVRVGLPRCMDLITAAHVCEAIEGYLAVQLPSRATVSRERNGRLTVGAPLNEAAQ